MLTACGDSDDDPPLPQDTVVGAAGDTVTGPNGAMLVIPPGALASDTSFNIPQSDAGAPALPGTLSVYGQTCAITPHGTSFAVPATVTVPFDSALVPAGGVPLLYKTNALNQWEPVATVDGSTMVAQISGLSWSVVGAPNRGSRADAIVDQRRRRVRVGLCARNPGDADAVRWLARRRLAGL